MALQYKNNLTSIKELIDITSSSKKENREQSDDYSLESVPRNKRNMGWISITNITFGIATAIFYFQLGSVMALQFGAINALISAGYAIVVAGILGTFIAYL